MERVVEALTILHAAFADLTPSVVYGILRLRSVAFVVEQDCVYLDADGRDLEDGAVHVWVEDDDTGEVVACARILPEDNGVSIGRLVTAPSHRGRSLGEAVMAHALSIATRPARIHAQSHLVDWYARMGFTPCGPEFLEDGIPHTPMVVDG